jgi:hypothetical protein
MMTLKSAAEIAEIVAKIETELDRLGWKGTGVEPCAFDAEATGSLPNGWVSLACDSSSIYGDSERVLEALKSENGYGEFAECFATLDFTDRAPSSSRDWPADLIEFEQLEDGTANDNPITLVTVGTNAGLRHAVGPHGVSECALGNWMGSGEELAETRESALTSV